MTETNYQALNQVCRYAENVRIEKLEDEVKQLKSMVLLFDWIDCADLWVPTGSNIEICISAIQAGEPKHYESYCFMRRNYTKNHHVRMGLFGGDEYNDGNISILIHLEVNRAIVIISRMYGADLHSFYTMTRERGDALIAFIESKRA